MGDFSRQAGGRRDFTVDCKRGVVTQVVTGENAPTGVTRRPPFDVAEDFPLPGSSQSNTAAKPT